MENKTIRTVTLAELLTNYRPEDVIKCITGSDLLPLKKPDRSK